MTIEAMGPWTRIFSMLMDSTWFSDYLLEKIPNDFIHPNHSSNRSDHTIVFPSHEINEDVIECVDDRNIQENRRNNRSSSVRRATEAEPS